MLIIPKRSRLLDNTKKDEPFSVKLNFKNKGHVSSNPAKDKSIKFDVNGDKEVGDGEYLDPSYTGFKKQRSCISYPGTGYPSTMIEPIMVLPRTKPINTWNYEPVLDGFYLLFRVILG
jgi:hypothetical protein